MTEEITVSCLSTSGYVNLKHQGLGYVGKCFNLITHLFLLKMQRKVSPILHRVKIIFQKVILNSYNFTGYVVNDAF